MELLLPLWQPASRLFSAESEFDSTEWVFLMPKLWSVPDRLLAEYNLNPPETEYATSLFFLFCFKS